MAGDVLGDIADLAADLADPRQHTERTPYWDHNHNRKWRTHVTVQPGLLAQLYESVQPGSTSQDDSRRPHPTSRPPLALEALSTHTVIVIAITRWCWTLHIDLRDTAEANLRALVGAAPTLDRDTAHKLLADMRRWRRWCAVMTGWETGLFAPRRVPCPSCERRGTLRVNLSAQTAYCKGQWDAIKAEYDCGATWDPDTIGLLARHIRRVTGSHAA